MRETAFGLFLAIATSLIALLAAAWPSPGRPLMVVFPSGTSTKIMSEAIAQADGSLLDIDAAYAIVMTIGEDTEFVSALYHAGAWLVLDGSVAGMCARARRWASP